MRRAWPTALVVLVACTTADYYRLVEEALPKVEVLAIAARFPTETSGQLEFRLAIPNKAEDGLKVIRVDWEVWLENRHFSTGQQIVSFDVGPREERVLYLDVPVAYRKLPLRRGPIHLEIGLRGKMLVRYGDKEEIEPISIYFARRMEVLCENAPIFPPPGKVQEGQ
jgi:hypothetical protein